MQPPPQPLIQPASLEWASAVGNQAVQRLARRYAEPAAEEEEQAPAEPEESAAPPAEEAAALAAVDDDAETLPE